jgi:hypothetical protein
MTESRSCIRRFLNGWNCLERLELLDQVENVQIVQNDQGAGTKELGNVSRRVLCGNATGR